MLNSVLIESLLVEPPLGMFIACRIACLQRFSIGCSLIVQLPAVIVPAWKVPYFEIHLRLALLLLSSSLGRFCAVGARKDSPSRNSPVCFQRQIVSIRHLQDDEQLISSTQ